MEVPKKLRSRKLWVAIITAFAIFLTEVFGIEIDPENLVVVVLPIIAYILGEAWIDGRK